jgi:hypothetical protein
MTGCCGKTRAGCGGSTRSRHRSGGRTIHARRLAPVQQRSRGQPQAAQTIARLGRFTHERPGRVVHTGCHGAVTNPQHCPQTTATAHVDQRRVNDEPSPRVAPSSLSAVSGPDGPRAPLKAAADHCMGHAKTRRSLRTLRSPTVPMRTRPQIDRFADTSDCGSVRRTV